MQIREMLALPAQDLRSNLGTWAVPDGQVPAVVRVMTAHLPLETFDPDFRGQDLETVYFDTRAFDLRKARNQGERYLTLRIRCYEPSHAYALSAKTEDAKVRIPLDADTAAFLLAGNINLGLPALLPGDMQARLANLTRNDPLIPISTLRFRRYAVENDTDRLTFDIGTRTDAGKHLWTGVLEFKSTQADSIPPPQIDDLKLTPIKLSKFLWATRM